MKFFKFLGIIVLAVILIGGAFACTSDVLFLAQDTSEGGIYGVDMAALWSLNDGFEWIYPGSSYASNGATLHNIYMHEGGDPHQFAKEIIENTYHRSPNVLVIINNTASERIFGGDIISDIRENDWGQGMSRGDAISSALDDFSVNYLGVIESFFTGDLTIELI